LRGKPSAAASSGKDVVFPIARLEGETADIGATGIARQRLARAIGTRAKQNLPRDATDA
jgi:hypothetical protein